MRIPNIVFPWLDSLNSGAAVLKLISQSHLKEQRGEIASLQPLIQRLSFLEVILSG